ncbi:MAG: type II toxin-antitoxin system PemK/MazF family toxin, partial [Clostridium saudiense]|nr:type II toxin-antitoxin system PemK/MazF family toxin [Clostridium saudiense]
MKLIENIVRGEIYMADLDPCIGSEQGGIRPVVIIQNNTGNRFSTTTIVAPITTKLGKAYLPTHLVISKRTGIYKKSMILLEQIRIIDKSRLLEKLSILEDQEIDLMDRSLRISIG